MSGTDAKTVPAPSRTGLAVYALVTRLLRPVAPLLLRARLKRGKEDAARLGERYGIASRPRPEGNLVWFHAASIGESLSILTLIRRLIDEVPGVNVLVTTGTLTSAELLSQRLPKEAFHQFVPLDHPAFCARFLDHWKPDLAVWVESEFWPNLIAETDRRRIPLALINGRITEKSFQSWQRAPGMIADLVGRFSVILAQSAASADRLEALGAAYTELPGNLKHDAPAPSADPHALGALQHAIGKRPVWVATNTHEGEEEAAAQAHLSLAQTRPDLLTIILLRHPARGPQLAKTLSGMGLSVMTRSSGDVPAAHTQIYLVDTLGEVGLFYRLSNLVFVGGTFAEMGGHNPFEPARLGCALIAGPSDFNFQEAYAVLEEGGGMLRVLDANAMTQTIAALLDDTEKRMMMGEAARRIASEDSGATERTLAALLRLLAPKQKT
ncbi:3-deoxy-D-manno-octulosonic acid transferase [Parvibaculum sp.]|mgnify:CR=1 FL=1|uniref:3-deoxy-D-manno-octulosonic acid transferase n=1 Tax=Parvibaculum sp. TaxID=2024848 RepID=UPI0025EA8E4A|nr:3-deoxy-D-manno-octulosonic acid transferase [Parvibaculum sp.]